MHFSSLRVAYLLIALPLLTAADGDACGTSPPADVDGGVGEACGDACDGDTCEPCAFAPFADEVWTWDQTVDRCSYSNNGNIFWDWMMEGREPALAGRYPVFIYLVGTGDVATRPAALSVVESMAARGYVAASVAYASLDGIGAVLGDPTLACPIVAKKGECIFGAGEGSAVSKLCARAKADCTRGIVIAGHSQGAMLATIAKNHESRVRAVYGMGLGIHEHIYIAALNLNVDADVSACALPANRALPADRLRVVNGESEYVYGTSLQQDMRDITGTSCAAGTLECLRADGSGWVMFPDAASESDRDEVTNELVARHCYFANTPPGDCGGNYIGLNSNWTTGSASYARESNLSWLSSHVY